MQLSKHIFWDVDINSVDFQKHSQMVIERVATYGNLDTLLEFVNLKYPNHTDILTLKSLVYFEDAESQPECELLIDVSWREIKHKIEKETIKFL